MAEPSDYCEAPTAKVGDHLIRRMVDGLAPVARKHDIEGW